MVAHKFPKTVLVKYEDPDNSEPYMIVLNGGLSSDEESGEAVATYQLVKVERTKITRELV